MEPPSLAPLPAVLSTQEVAELLRMSPRSVLEMVKAGTLRGHRPPGRRRYHFLAEDVLAVVSGRSNGLRPGHVQRPPSPPPNGAPVDPCDVWGAAPARDLPDWEGRCLARWVDMAVAAGLSPTATEGRGGSAERGVGTVDVDGIAYEILAGPRQRVRCLDADGEPTWMLIESVWVEPRP